MTYGVAVDGLPSLHSESDTTEDVDRYTIPHVETEDFFTNTTKQDIPKDVATSDTGYDLSRYMVGLRGRTDS